jgi:short-subunit dehydrogenase
MKRAIVIGASSGIGQGIARRLMSEGYKVGVMARRAKNLDKLKSIRPSDVIADTLDVRQVESHEELLQKMVEDLGGLDLFILCAGVGQINEELDFYKERETITTNVLGFTSVVDWVFNYFQSQGKGHIVAITSVAGLRGNKAAPSYNASKSYQINYLEGLRQKAIKLTLDIKVTDIRPGFVDTAMAQGPGLFWVASVDKATEQIWSAIRRRKSVTYVTSRWRFIGGLLKALPRAIYHRM